jgi:hypothetical protein
MMLWLCVTAWAHPFGDRFAAHQLTLHLRDDALEVRYRADVPTALIDADAAAQQRPPPAEPMAALLRELSAGVVVVVDGRAVPLQASEPPTVRPATHSVQVGLSWTAPLAPSDHRIDLSNGNLPEVPAYHATLVTVGPMWQSQGDTVEPTGSWSLDPGQRRARFAVRRTDGPLDRWWRWTAASPAQVPAAAAHAPGWSPLTAPTGSAPTAALALAGAAALGAGSPRSRWGGRVVAVGAVGVALAAAVPGTAHAPVGGVLGLAAAAAAIAAPAVAPLVALLAMLAAAPWRLAAQGALLAAVVHLGAHRGPGTPAPSRAALLLCLAVAAVLLARAG